MSKEAEYLTKAIAYIHEAIDVTKQRKHDGAVVSNNLSIWLSTRYGVD